jgi:hypothetical protein
MNQEIELFITTMVVYHQEWLEMQINRTLRLHSKTAIRLPTGKLKLPTGKLMYSE